MTLLIVGSVRLPVDRIAAAREAMLQMVAASRAEDGCLDYSYAFDLVDEGLVRVCEAWRDQAALDRHFASAHLHEWRACWTTFGIRERNLRMYDVGESRAT